MSHTQRSSDIIRMVMDNHLRFVLLARTFQGVLCLGTKTKIKEMQR